MKKQYKILVVDDDEVIRTMMQHLLETSDFRCDVAKDGPEAIRMVAEKHPDLIILDVSMPTMDGFEVCRILRGEEKSSDIPILFLSAKVELEDRMKGFQMGADDYIPKPFSYDELVARIKVSLRKMERLEREKRKSESLELVTRCDESTGLFNRKYFDMLLKEEIAKSIHVGAPLSIMLIDIDRLNEINSTYGFHQGNHTIVQLAQLIQQICAGKGIIARYEGGTFAVLMPGRDVKKGAELAEELRRMVESTVIDAYPSGIMKTTITLGVIEWDIKDSPEHLMRKAEEALHSGKKFGRNRVAVS
jgi:two-component system, cell cycle response regulator